jgi:GNAT superfamily N-acetyltransferase
MLPLNPPEPLKLSHEVAGFDCGSVALNSYLKLHAFASHQGSTNRTYVATRGNEVIGYYTIAPASVSPDDVPERMMKGQGKYPVPIILLARLAVDSRESGKGIGKGLLKDALLRAARAAHEIGGRAVGVHAKDENAKRFYEKHGFSASPLDAFHLYVLMKDVIKSLN